jgi:hypothetical protein
VVTIVPALAPGDLGRLFLYNRSTHTLNIAYWGEDLNHIKFPYKTRVFKCPNLCPKSRTS